jgi:hypothetical protein
MEVPIRILDVPTLSEWGLIAMVVVMGIVAAVALHKHFAAQSR